MIRNILFAGASALALAACGGGNEDYQASENAAEETATAQVEQAQEAATEMTSAAKLAAVLDGQSDETKARYDARHPAETIAFFGIEPGMTVIDTLPGDPWYSGILSEYLGADGLVIGVQYSIEQRKGMARSPLSEEKIAERLAWPATWLADREAARKDGEAPFEAYLYGALPESKDNSVDVVLMIRAAHHMNKVGNEAAHFKAALADAMRVLKPGGTLGIVQHRAPEGNDDEWAKGFNGYVKQSQVIAVVEGAGFELVEASEINANPKDVPTTEDKVWRLPPNLSGTQDDPEQRARNIEIGETDRMTLKFRAPAE